MEMLGVKEDLCNQINQDVIIKCKRDQEYLICTTAYRLIKVFIKKTAKKICTSIFQTLVLAFILIGGSVKVAGMLSEWQHLLLGKAKVGFLRIFSSLAILSTR
jgi:ribulose 1,5-bisphosphate synthetase/thiazole synthase